jgi:hypothetical protein
MRGSGSGNGTSFDPMGMFTKLASPDFGWSKILAPYRWPLFLFSMLVFFSMGHFAGAFQKEQEILRAKAIASERFELLSPAGKTAALLRLNPRGQGELTIFDERADPRVEIGFDARGSPGVRLLGTDHRLRASLLIDSQTGAPRLDFIDDKGNSAIKLEISPRFGPSVIVGSKLQNRINIGISKDGSPGITLWDQRFPRLMMSMVQGKPSIRLMDADNVDRSTWKVGKDGSPSFSLRDRNDKDRVVMSIDNDEEAALRFLDAAGKTLKELRIAPR